MGILRVSLSFLVLLLCTLALGCIKESKEEFEEDVEVSGSIFIDSELGTDSEYPITIQAF